MIASKGAAKMSSRRGKAAGPGWAAFDLQQRQKDIPEAQLNGEPFPSLQGHSTTVQPPEAFSRNDRHSAKPFSSVIVRSASSPDIAVGNKKSDSSEAGGSIGLEVSDILRNNKVREVFRQLKELYSWADDSLIEDIMSATGNDFDMTSSFLKSMFSDERLEMNEDNAVVKAGRDSIEHESKDNGLKRDISSRESVEPSKASSVMNSHVGDNNGELVNEFGPYADKISDGCMDINNMLGQLRFVPIEPEWEEDDLYLSCRKDAIKMMRAAARHSKAASNSFLRGDHISARQFSLQAQEEWAAAERLNEKAALEILSIRNENNGIWRLDLHGLHAAEAVQALQERLYMIETQALLKGSSPLGVPNSCRIKGEILQDSSCGSSNMEKSGELRVFGQKPMWLEVITGIGNHSRGGAALPAAVRTFLADNGYHSDEARPGVIMVRPKIRHC